MCACDLATIIYSWLTIYFFIKAVFVDHNPTQSVFCDVYNKGRARKQRAIVVCDFVLAFFVGTFFVPVTDATDYATLTHPTCC